MTEGTGIEVQDLSDLSPAMRAALLDGHGRPNTVAALARRGLAHRRGAKWLVLTEAGERAVRQIQANVDAAIQEATVVRIVEDGSTVVDIVTNERPEPSVDGALRQAAEVYDPFWVRSLVETVGRELHDMDMLAAQEPSIDSGYAHGQRDTWTHAAKYLASAVRQSVKRLGLAGVLEASRAGAGAAEVAAVPQRTPADEVYGTLAELVDEEG